MFCDTQTEDEDTYRFLREGAADVGGELVTLADGRDVWEVFRDSRFIGNTRADPCSRILKRELAQTWIDTYFTPKTCVRYVGLDWTETHRLDRLRAHLAPWTVEAPLCEKPHLSRSEMFDECRAAGITPPRLYGLGFQHNNCGGFCVKAGHAQFRHLLKTMPERFRHHEEKEEELRLHLGSDVSILRDRRGGQTVPMTMREFRERIEAGGEIDLFDWAGCGCFSDVGETAT